MAATAVLESQNVRVEPFDCDRHLNESYLGWLNDPQVVKYSQQRLRRHTLDSCRAYAESFRGSPNHFWAIVSQEGSRHVGTMTAYLQEVDGVADLGILLGDRSVWGKGFATSAWRLVCDHLLGTVGLRKITAGTLSVNTPMLRLMERTGMIDDGRRRSQVLWEGQPVDVVYAALFREQWLQAAAARRKNLVNEVGPPSRA